MKRPFLIYLIPGLLFLISAGGKCSLMAPAAPIGHETNKVTVPIGGNAWLLNAASTEKITKEGLTQWTNPQTVCRTYVRISQPGQLKLSVTLTASEGTVYQTTLMGKTLSFTASSEGLNEYFVGEWNIKKAGYLPIDLQGITKKGATFGSVQSISLSGSAVSTETVFVKDNTDNYFYWGRRGPSVHLKYTLPPNEDIEWFYNELTIPEGQDVIGSYFMANGFAEGYFGIQVNSSTERRILFSVWSPFKTDNPEAIPDDQKIRLLKKGQDVYTGEFGNEGAGGQSYLKYSWKAGNTYRFLLQGKPTADSYTTYSAYFFAPEENQWRLIASFKRPKTSAYLKSLHSFLENFIPDTGNVGRMGLYANQWVRTVNGRWLELTEAKFTGDATARKNYRKDYAGGLSNGHFYLRNCGFFNDFVPLDGTFKRAAVNKMPEINFSALP
ncbi:DUF3472 domain-containing protein [Runella slithyformis]|uniref:Nb031 nematoblast specific protein n=1 Tax=Runella slithyformis (strain ATCC 29530 / DSM 19594 / LMG 11500 / NCIMB 11436 / LSU 4) TaxID=761193 RepID=A0A7U4E702_RUNSL|nr:DUF3472 domain-containing protein [Runella slithyformis]AEI49798.1 nb031; nematoblast specific protein [Runella slithyformis DSM 19594]